MEIPGSYLAETLDIFLIILCSSSLSSIRQGVPTTFYKIRNSLLLKNVNFYITRY